MSEVVDRTQNPDTPGKPQNISWPLESCTIAGVEYQYDDNKWAFYDNKWRALTTLYGKNVSEIFDRGDDFMALQYIPVIFEKDSWKNMYIISPKRYVWIFKKIISNILSKIWI